MSDTDSNQGEAEYSDDSDYENADQSFISGRQSKNIDESIVQQTVQFKDIPKVDNQYKASVYTKKKKQVEKEEQPQVNPYPNQPNKVESNQHEVTQASEPNPTNNKQIFQSVTVSKILQEETLIHARQAYEHQIIEGKQMPIDKIINDEEDGEAVYSDDEVIDPQLGRESYMSTSPQNIQFTSHQQNIQPQEKGGMYKKNQLPAQQEYEAQIQKEELNEPHEIQPQEHKVHQENNYYIQQQDKLQDGEPLLVTVQQTAKVQEIKSQQPVDNSYRQPQQIQQASKNDEQILFSVSQSQPNIQKLEESLEKKLQEQNEENYKEDNEEKYELMHQQKYQELASVEENFKPVQHIMQQSKQQQSPVVELQQSKEQLSQSQKIKVEMQVEKAQQQISSQNQHNHIAQSQQQVNQVQQQSQQPSNYMISASPQSNQHSLQEIKRQQRQEKQQGMATLDSARSAQPTNQQIVQSEEIKQQNIIPQVKVEKAQAERETQKIQQLNTNAINQQKEAQFAQKPNQLNLLANLKVVPTNQSQYSEDQVQRKLFPSDLQKKSQASVIMISRKAEKQYIPIESSNQSYAQLSNDTPPRFPTITNPPRTMTKLSSQIKEQPKGGESQACKCEIM